MPQKFNQPFVSENMLRILDGIDDAVYIADPITFELLFGNRSFVKQWGRYENQKCYKVIQNRSSPCPFCTNHLIFGDNLGSTHEWEFQNEKNKKWYRCMDKAIEWTDGQMVRMELAGDITKRKNLEFELQNKNKELEVLNELNNRLFSILSHDIRTPLNEAKILTELFRLKLMSKTEVDEHLSNFSDKTDNLLDFLNDILRWAQYQSKNGQKLNIVNFSTAISIHKTLLLYEVLLAKKEIKINIINIKCTGFADPDLYTLITRNLIQNAIKFTPRGKSISIHVKEEDDVINTVIEDTGVGIRDDILEKILSGKPVYTYGTESEKGSGLGLQMCFKYAQMLGGDIQIHSRPNHGTRAEFRIPGRSREIGRITD